MNPDNCASLEASKRLVEAGIVLETEMGWYKIFRPGSHVFDWVLSWRGGNKGTFFGDNYPAPSMAEVWRELPPGTELRKAHSFTEAFSFADTENADSIYPPCNSPDNPTDALIDLLIWVRWVNRRTGGQP
jgi:hypothetical protein